MRTEVVQANMADVQDPTIGSERPELVQKV